MTRSASGKNGVRPRKKKVEANVCCHNCGCDCAAVKEEIRVKDQRIASLEAVGERLLLLYGNEWSDTDQQTALRTLRAILEHRPHLPLPPLKEHKKTP